jgi:hypothetical protein
LFQECPTPRPSSYVKHWQKKKFNFCNMMPEGYQKGITGKKLMKREPGHFAK